MEPKGDDEFHNTAQLKAYEVVSRQAVNFRFPPAPPRFSPCYWALPAWQTARSKADICALKQRLLSCILVGGGGVDLGNFAYVT